MSSELIWQHTESPGWEHVRVDSSHPGWDVYDSILVREYKAQVLRGGYTLVTDKQWRTLELRLMIESAPGSMEGVHLLTEGDGKWMDANEQHIPELDGCLDVAIEWTPLTLSLPFNRILLNENETQSVVLVSISLPDLVINPIAVNLTKLNATSAQFESPIEGVQSKIHFGEDGFQVSGLGFTRSWPRS